MLELGNFNGMARVRVSDKEAGSRRGVSPEDTWGSRVQAEELEAPEPPGESEEPHHHLGQLGVSLPARLRVVRRRHLHANASSTPISLTLHILPFFYLGHN